MSDERESREKRPRPRYAAADDGNRQRSDRPSGRGRENSGREHSADRTDSSRRERSGGDGGGTDRRPSGGGARGADRTSSGRPAGGKSYGDKSYGDKRYGDKRTGDKPYGDKRYGDQRTGDKHTGAGRPDGQKPYGQKPYGAKKPYGGKRFDDRPSDDRRAASDKPYGEKRAGDRPYGDKRASGRPPYGDKREAGRPPHGAKRDAGGARKGEYRGDRPYGDRRESGASRDSRPGTPRSGQRRDDRYGGPTGRPPRAGSRDDRSREHVRDTEERVPRHPAPPIPEDVTPRDLNPAARNELKTLSKENAENVARHLAMAAALIDDDPSLAHEHALAAVRSAGRIAVVRETAAITAYAIGDYALALRELRTFRRISGRDDQIALMVDSERGVGRPDRALELGRSVDRSALAPAVRVELAIAMSGARLDLGQTERALLELDIPELDPDRAFEWSPALFSARAAVLEELGRTDEAQEWQHRAVVAAEAIDDASGVADSETILIEEVAEEPDAEESVEPTDDEPAEVEAADDDAQGGASGSTGSTGSAAAAAVVDEDSE
ncbi:primosomal protein [Microbacterium immunditiarum]|uniref:Primosomal protein n=1 Tax=Microbacterium immunditiarum TaxID=337480 RepID=A0A7Y9GMA0_9MICO|nr:primosomal protein [Microbacterium immunditiarum]NYE19113.1 hypothetical protein [Microbacterium immunditiarum]